MIQASGQANWADPIWVETLKYMEGQHVTSSSGVNLDVEWGCSLTAGTCRQLYCCISLIKLWGMDITYHNLLWVSISHSSTIEATLMNSSSHGGVSSLWMCTISAPFPFPWHQWWETFSAPSDLVGCWPAVLELWHFACQWPFLEQPLQMAFHAGQLSQPG